MTLLASTTCMQHNDTNQIKLLIHLTQQISSTIELHLEIKDNAAQDEQSC